MKKIMRNIILKTFNLSLIIVLLLSTFLIMPEKTEAKEANTLAELRKELSALQAKKKKIENEKKLTQQEINEKNNAITDAHNQIDESEAKITQAKKDIESSTTKISELQDQTKQLMAFYQIMSGENTYLEFISNASSLTDMIMRKDAVDSIAKYNRDKLEELDKLIVDLEQKQVDLKKYEEELNANIEKFEARIDELDSSLLAFDDDRMSIDEEIKALKDKIKMLEDAGCGENQDIDVCLSNGTNVTFLKPVAKGRITSVFGYRKVSGQSSNHSGIDIGLTEGTPVYSMINGTVSMIVKKSSCGGNKLYIEGIVNGQKYTVVYLHLLSISVKAGDKVTNQTIVAKSGGGSTAKRNGGYDTCTTGAHLHVSVSKGYWVNDATYRKNLINPPGFPGKGGWFYSRTQWFD